MAPAKKKGNKGNRTATVIHGVSTADMTKEEIESFVVLIREELERERQERNLAVLEKDKIITFWELTKKQLDDARALLCKKERELEDSDERHQLEMKIYRQKLKHLMFEQNSKESENKKESLQNLTNAKDEARSEIRAIRNENYTLKARLRQQLVESEESIKLLKRQHELDLADIRQDFSRQTEELEAKAAKQMTMLRDQIDTQRRVEVHATEERKNLHIQNLELNHEQAFANMKAYYNDITLGNVSVIKTLREHIDELRSQLARVQHLLDTSQSELNQKSETLTKTEKENQHLRQIAQLYETEKSAHSLTKSNAKQTLKNYKMLQDDYDLLTSRFEALDKMRDSLASNFEKILLEVQQRMSLRSLLIEKKLKHLAETLEAREAQVMQLVIALEGDPKAVNTARQHLEELLKVKNESISELQYEVMRMGKAYNELWSTCQRKLVDEMNSPVNLGIIPVKVNVNLVSPFNPSTALGTKLIGDEKRNLCETPIGKPKTTNLKIGQGPVGLASVAPF